MPSQSQLSVDNFIGACQSQEFKDGQLKFSKRPPLVNQSVNLAQHKGSTLVKKLRIKKKDSVEGSRN